MNEGITEIVNLMFAPNPIPQSVVAAVDRTVFLLNKIDAPTLSPKELVVIAGCAMANSGMSTVAVVGPKEIDMSAEISTAPDRSQPPAAPSVVQGGRMDAPPANSDKAKSQTYDQLRTMDRNELKVHATMLGLSIPDGISDEQACDFLMGRPIQHPQRTRKTPAATASAAPKALSETKMLKMTLLQLREHALAVYEYKAPVRYKKDILAAVLQQMTPIN